MILHVDDTVMAPCCIELAQVILPLIPGTGVNGLEVDDGDIGRLYGLFGDSHDESSVDDDEA